MNRMKAELMEVGKIVQETKQLIHYRKVTFYYIPYVVMELVSTCLV